MTSVKEEVLRISLPQLLKSSKVPPFTHHLWTQINFHRQSAAIVSKPLSCKKSHLPQNFIKLFCRFILWHSKPLTLMILTLSSPQPPALPKRLSLNPTQSTFATSTVPPGSFTVKNCRKTIWRNL